MKRIIIIAISLFIMPILVNAETLTYDVCDTCEYKNLNRVENDINSISDLSDKDIFINIKQDFDDYLDIGFLDNVANSVTINGNNHSLGKRDFRFFTKTVKIENVKYINQIGIFNSSKVNITNSSITMIAIAYVSGVYYDYFHPSEKLVNLSDVLDINEIISNNNISVLGLIGNIKIEELDLRNYLIYVVGGNINIYNSKIQKVLNFTEVEENIITNIYNSTFDTLKYISVSTPEEYSLAFKNITNFGDPLEDYAYDIYDVNGSILGGTATANTHVYFDKDAEIKVNDRLNLVDYLDYYTEDKEISYTIEDETIAKIENKDLIGLKPGNTKVQVTTDDGHIIYNIDLTVYTISEKNVTMKAETKLKLNSVFKDLDISSISDDVWEISNPKVAKIVNGEIISLAKGETDIVATINGVKYIYHLTVSDTLVSKEIKVPITGKRIKLWVVIVTILLLSVIGVCSYILIKKHK